VTRAPGTLPRTRAIAAGAGALCLAGAIALHAADRRFAPAPDVHEPKPRFLWITAGSVLAVLLWLVASAGFGIYVANFASYNKTYGSLAGIVVFLVWLWISNLAVLLGASFDAELARSRREAVQ